LKVKSRAKGIGADRKWGHSRRSLGGELIEEAEPGFFADIPV
jgi:hypothetical protein